MHLEKEGLKISLQKNIDEIRSLAFTKLIRYINKNMYSIETSFLVKSISLLKSYKDIYEKFLKTYLKLRKNTNTNLMNDILYKSSLITTKDYNKYFDSVFTGLEECIGKEMDYLLG